MQPAVNLSISLLILKLYYAQSTALPSSLEQCNTVGCSGYQCFESIANCGQQGYLTAYGEKYCSRFHENKIFHSFDKSGQKFIRCTAQCLLDNMQSFFQAQKQSNNNSNNPSSSATAAVDCDQLKETAFDSHVQCYLQCNFCTICQNNKMALWHTYDLTDFLNWLAIKKVFATIYKCGVFQCF